MRWQTALKEGLLILLGSILYGISTAAFIFPGGLILGGTSGISVILASFISFSPGTIISIINISLVVVAFVVLGKDAGIKTLVGSILTTLSITALEQILALKEPPVANPYISALIGAVIIAIASGILFYVGSSSGGTDIIALIVKKFSRLQIGRCLLATDVLIVILGGLLYDYRLLLSSVIGLVVKTLGIDVVIRFIKKFVLRKSAAN